MPLTSPSSVPRPRCATATGPRTRPSSSRGQRLGRLGRGPLPGDDHGVRAVERVPPLAPRPRRQRPAHRAGGLRAHHQHVEVAVHVEPLVGVVEHQDLRAVGQRALGAGDAVRVGHDHRLGHRVLVHQRLVVAVAAEQDAGPEAARDVVPGDPDGDRRLARAADRQVADRHRGQRQVARRRTSRAGTRAAGCPSRAARAPRRGQQRQAGQPRVGPPAGPQPAHDAVGVAPAAHRRSSPPAISRSRSSASRQSGREPGVAGGHLERVGRTRCGPARRASES